MSLLIFHADSPYSPPNSWNDETSSNQHFSTNIFHLIRFYVQPNSYSRTVVVPVSSFHPIQSSFGHPFASLLLQPFAFIHTLAPFCASSSVNPLQSLGDSTRRIFDDTRKYDTSVPKAFLMIRENMIQVILHMRKYDMSVPNAFLMIQENIIQVILQFDSSVPVFGFGFDVYQINLLYIVCKYLQIDFVYF